MQVSALLCAFAWSFTGLAQERRQVQFDFEEMEIFAELPRPEGLDGAENPGEAHFLLGQNREALGALRTLVDRQQVGPPTRLETEMLKTAAQRLAALFHDDDWNRDGQRDEPAWVDRVLAWTAVRPWVEEAILARYGHLLAREGTPLALADCVVVFDALLQRCPASLEADTYRTGRDSCRKMLTAVPERPTRNPRIELRRTALSRLPAIRACYSHALRSPDPPTAGKLTVRLILQPGTPVQVEPVAFSVPEPLAECAARKLANVRWPLPANAIWEAHFPFVFKAD